MTIAYAPVYRQLELDFSVVYLPKRTGKRVELPNIPVYSGLNEEQERQVYFDMHQWVLEESLQSIKDMDGDALDAIGWAFSPDFIDWLEKVPGERSILIRRHQSDIPFSFYRCCKFLQYDPDAIRSDLSGLVSELLQSEHALKFYGATEREEMMRLINFTQEIA